MLRYWVFLFFAIIAEVSATLSLKIANTQIWGYVIMGVLIIFSYIFMGLAIKKIPVGVAYVIWEVLGLCIIVLFGIIFFEERLNNLEKLGIVLGIMGIILINIGAKK